MEIGIAQLLPSFAYQNLSDAQLYADEIELAVAADELGYDHLWAVEHHFEDYSLCPDNFVYLAHLAARTKRIKFFRRDRGRLATGRHAHQRHGNQTNQHAKNDFTAPAEHAHSRG